MKDGLDALPLAERERCWEEELGRILKGIDERQFATARAVEEALHDSSGIIGPFGATKAELDFLYDDITLRLRIAEMLGMSDNLSELDMPQLVKMVGRARITIRNSKDRPVGKIIRKLKRDFGELFGHLPRLGFDFVKAEKDGDIAYLGSMINAHRNGGTVHKQKKRQEEMVAYLRGAGYKPTDLPPEMLEYLTGIGVHLDKIRGWV